MNPLGRAHLIDCFFRVCIAAMVMTVIIAAYCSVSFIGVDGDDVTTPCVVLSFVGGLWRCTQMEVGSKSKFRIFAKRKSTIRILSCLLSCPC